MRKPRYELSFMWNDVCSAPVRFELSVLRHYSTTLDQIPAECDPPSSSLLSTIKALQDTSSKARHGAFKNLLSRGHFKTTRRLGNIRKSPSKKFSTQRRRGSSISLIRTLESFLEASNKWRSGVLTEPVSRQNPAVPPRNLIIRRLTDTPVFRRVDLSGWHSQEVTHKRDDDEKPRIATVDVTLRCCLHERFSNHDRTRLFTKTREVPPNKYSSFFHVSKHWSKSVFIFVVLSSETWRHVPIEHKEIFQVLVLFLTLFTQICEFALCSQRMSSVVTRACGWRPADYLWGHSLDSSWYLSLFK